MTCPKCGYVMMDRPRTTGPRSQQMHLNGHIQAICRETGNDFDAVKSWVKVKAAMERGYPTDTFRGSIAPRSESRATVAEASLLIDVVHELAAELGIRLQEDE